MTPNRLGLLSAISIATLITATACETRKGSPATGTTNPNPDATTAMGDGGVNNGDTSTMNNGDTGTMNNGDTGTMNNGDTGTMSAMDATTVADTGVDPAATCQGFCGGQAPSGCFCDQDCPGADCCADFCTVCGGCTGATDPNMSFFVTSRGVEVAGNAVTGGNLGGLAGADAFCTLLAREVLPTNTRTWRAYLSTATVDARSRIGSGPWINAAGVQIAANVDALHATPPPRARLLTETGDDPLAGGQRHDILTGSKADGRRFANLGELMPFFTFPDGSFTYPNAAFDPHCNSWMTDNTQTDLNQIVNYAVVGHVDWDALAGGSASWTTSHVTACDIAIFNLDGGDARVYCFAE